MTTVPDLVALPAFEAVCVTGEHCAQSGHELYEQTVRALVRAEPGAWQ
ncbi:hypothetical protein PUR57_20795 [Streptomyces sp. JV176]|nr:hypothetical protein [Streptomyces sp. JV176]MEE1801088.1 hypothetical protein [Streptomyces sp. JV176]